MTGVALADAEVAVVDEALRTTRAHRRRLDLARAVDPVDLEACIEVAVHAPSAENHQNWRWLVVTDPDRRFALAELYRQAWAIHRAGQAGRVRRRRGASDASNLASVDWLACHLHEVPTLVIPCVVGRPPRPGTWGNRDDHDLDHLANVIFYGSALPAVWSFQVALRTRGLGSVFTCMHLPFEAEAARVLGVPRSVTQVGLLPVGHLTGAELRPAPRAPARIMWEEWGDDVAAR